MTELYAFDANELNDPRLFAENYEKISDVRRKKVDAFRFQRDKNLSLGASILLKHGLERHGLSEKDIVYAIQTHRKPYFRDYPDLHFSLSHSKTKVIAAFSHQEVGCDIEAIAPRDLQMEASAEDSAFESEPPTHLLRLARRFFTASECQAIASCKSSAQSDETFYRLWTLKESFLKITGLGMSLPLDAFEIHLEGSRIQVIQQVDQQPYYFKEYTAYPGFCCALCTHEPTRAPIQYYSLLSFPEV